MLVDDDKDNGPESQRVSSGTGAVIPVPVRIIWCPRHSIWNWKWAKGGKDILEDVENLGLQSILHPKFD